MEETYKFLLLAFEEAERALEEGTYPIGAVIVDEQGNVVSRGRNRVFTTSDPTAHAEVDAIRNAGHEIINTDTKRIMKKGLTLYTTCEPCPMCACTILLSGIRKVVWAANDEEIGALRKLKEGSFFVEKFNKIEVIEAPFLDLELKQRKMLADYNVQRGFLDTHWKVAIEKII